jgi:hypothetical protein
MIEIVVISAAFTMGGAIPPIYTCHGANISPQISWQHIPTNTESIALICDDPDAPVGDWVHWVVFNIPPDSTGLEENTPPHAHLPDGSIQGITDFRRPGYGGPCPPSGTHRYFFRVYALDTMLDLKDSATKADLLKAMKGHILGKGELMGTFAAR